MPVTAPRAPPCSSLASAATATTPTVSAPLVVPLLIEDPLGPPGDCGQSNSFGSGGSNDRAVVGDVV